MQQALLCRRWRRDRAENGVENDMVDIQDHSDTDSGATQRRPYPVVSADCHMSEPAELYEPLQAEFPAQAPHVVEHAGQQWFAAAGVPPYPTLPKPLPDVWGDARY